MGGGRGKASAVARRPTTKPARSDKSEAGNGLPPSFHSRSICVQFKDAKTRPSRNSGGSFKRQSVRRQCWRPPFPIVAGRGSARGPAKAASADGGLSQPQPASATAPRVPKQPSVSEQSPGARIQGAGSACAARARPATRRPASPRASALVSQLRVPPWTSWLKCFVRLIFGVERPWRRGNCRGGGGGNDYERMLSTRERML